MAPTGTDLAVRRNPRLALAGGAVVLLGTAALVTWHAHSPAALPVDARTISATTPVGAPIYLGVFPGDLAFTRTLDLSGVKVHTTSNTAVSVTPLLCRDGAPQVTTDPSAFCSELVNPEGQVLGPGDSIVLEVTSDVPAVAVIDPVRLGFREHLQWGTLPAGAGAVVQVLAR